MPPKRKRAAQEEPTAEERTVPARSTRSATKAAKIDTDAASSTSSAKTPPPKPAPNAKAAASKAKKAAVVGEQEGDEEEEQEVKPKKRGRPPKSATAAKAKKQPSPERDEELPPPASKRRKTTVVADDVERDAPEEPRAEPPAKKAPNSSKSKKVTSVQPKKNTVAPFTASHAATLFEEYRDKDTKGDEEDVIGPEGMEKLCQDAELDMAGAKPILLAWTLGAKEMGKFTRGEWTEGTSRWKIDTPRRISTVVADLDALLFPPASSSAPDSKAKSKPGAAESYNKDIFAEYAIDPDAAFKKLYMFAFQLAKPEQARNIDMETTTALWSVLLAPRYPICNDLIAFVNERPNYKGVNKDLWSMTLEFCKEVKPEDLATYESDGAWPTLMDDFVAHMKSPNAQQSV